MIRNDFHDRKRLRIAQHDYASSCIYFVTTNIDFHTECFGKIANEKMELNINGKITEQQWLWLAEQYPYVTLDKFIVMPNHFHGIIAIDGEYKFRYESNALGSVGDGRDHPLQNMTPRPIQQSNHQRIKPLSELIGAFKTTSSKLIHRSGLVDFKWQRSFHERIIRNPLELDFMQKYIDDNPKNYKDKTK